MSSGRMESPLSRSFEPHRPRTRIRSAHQSLYKEKKECGRSEKGKGKMRTGKEGEVMTPVRALSKTYDYGETPDALRDLEKGWREKRRVVLGDIGVSNTPAPVRTRQLPSTKSTFKPRVARKQAGLPLSRPLPVLQPVATLPPSFQKFGSIPLPTPPHSPLPTKPSLEKVLPILPGNLPPTRHLVPLTSGSRSTILISPYPAVYPITLQLPDGLAVQIHKDGSLIRYQDPGSTKSNAWRLIRLSEQTRWTNEETARWEGIAKLVEGYKRATPMVSLAHKLALG